MASPAPSKSQPQPLHNFPLSQLKWSTKHQRVRSSPTSRLSSASPHRSPPHQSPLRHSLPPLQSPFREGEATSPPSPAHSQLSGGEDSGPPIRDGGAANHRRQPRVAVPLSPSAAGDPSGKDSRPPKVLIKIRNSGKVAEAEVAAEEDQGYDDEPKVWNLRPRKPIRKSLNLNGGAFKNEVSNPPETRSQSPAHRSKNGKSEAKKDKEKKATNNFSLTLSRDEIEEDIYSLFGTKLPRRPKKRQKAAQRIVDNLFPGAWLSTVTADSYKVYEHQGKA